MSRNLGEWLDYQQTLHPAAMALGLERVREVAAAMGLQRPAPRVISVAGTNGKGSTVAFAEAIAHAAGWRVGAYTSPHLRRYNERVRIDGRDVDDARLITAFERVEAARGAVPLTYFEFGTLAALALFADAALDLAVLEVGLGGRLDAVNLVDADVAVVTTVGLDHVELLGRDREAIGREKAGVFRAGRPAVVAEATPPASVLEAVTALGAKPVRAGVEYAFETGGEAGWRYRDARGALDLPLPALAAPCQTANAAAAIAALRQLDGWPREDAEAVGTGVAAARVAGRLQRIAGPVEIVLDVAHNPQAAQVLAQWLARNRSRGATLAVFAALADKDLPGLVGALLGQVDVWRLAGLSDAGSRKLPVEALWLQVASLLSRSLVHRHASVEDALAAARVQARPGDRIVVFGSFHTVGAALNVLEPDA